jgi:RNA polymerase sigma-70 factor, ECF subfamily
LGGAAFYWREMAERPPRFEERLPVAEARGGDPQAWDRLFQRYQRPLYAYVLPMVGEEQTALDLVQETFINAVRHIGSLQEEARFGSWLFSIAHQKCQQFWRKQRPWTPLEEEALEEVPDPAETPDALVLRHDQAAAFHRCLEALPLAQRSALVLHFLEDFSLEEIAALSSTSVGTIKSRIHYAKQKLRRHLIDHENEENTARIDP